MLKPSYKIEFRCACCQKTETIIKEPNRPWFDDENWLVFPSIHNPVVRICSDCAVKYFTYQRALQSQINNLTTELVEYEKDFGNNWTKLQNENNKLIKQLKETEQNIKECETEIHSLHDDLVVTEIELGTEIKKLKEENINLQAKCNNTILANNILNRGNNNLREEIEENTNTSNDWFTTLTDQVKQLENERNKYKHLYEIDRTAFCEREKELEKAVGDLDALRQNRNYKIKELKDIINTLETENENLLFDTHRWKKQYNDLKEFNDKNDIKYLKAGDLVLARNSGQRWQLHHFEKIYLNKFSCIGNKLFEECIPFKGNEHKL